MDDHQLKRQASSPFSFHEQVEVRSRFRHAQIDLTDIGCCLLQEVRKGIPPVDNDPSHH